MRISDWSSDVCSSDLPHRAAQRLLDVIGNALQLGATAGQHDLPPDRAVEAQRLERLLDLAGQHFEPLTDDRDQLRARNPRSLAQIGRASCRERVCQYV